MLFLYGFLFHRVKWKIFLFNDFATHEIYIFLTSRVKLKPYLTKDHLNVLFIIYNHFSKEVRFTFFQAIFSSFVP